MQPEHGGSVGSKGSVAGSGAGIEAGGSCEGQLAAAARAAEVAARTAGVGVKTNVQVAAAVVSFPVPAGVSR